ncbi:MAG: hypothetical protein ABFD54_15895 [Armatimonadota bacterium]|nr:hypothetical protein [bacterium]
MRTTGIVLMTFVLVAAAVGAWAQACPPATVGAGPQVYSPTIVGAGPQTCPPATGMQVPIGVPAAIGAGPATDLQYLTGSEFDRGYIRSMYQLNTTISALATQGIEQSTDKNLKDLSGKIRYEKTTQNEKLAMWYRDMGLGRVPVDYSRANAIVNTLLTPSDPQFNANYARTMTSLLQQDRDAAQLGVSRLTRDDVRDQAKIVVNSTQNEIVALQRWIGEKGYTGAY